MYCEFINKYEHSFLLQTDLKTIKGYKNRVKSIKKFHPDLSQLKIYYCSDSWILF